MKKIILFVSLILFLIPVSAFVEEDELKSQTTCPVMGGKIDKEIYLDYQGQRIYFCCESCKKSFSVDPEKYMQKI